MKMNNEIRKYFQYENSDSGSCVSMFSENETNTLFEKITLTKLYEAIKLILQNVS